MVSTRVVRRKRKRESTIPTLQRGGGRRQRQTGGLGPFAQQMALYSLAPIATQVVGNQLGNMMPGLGGGGQEGGGGAFQLPGNSRIIGLPNHLPSDTYYQLPRSRQRGGLALPRKPKRLGRKKTRRSQQGGIGPLAVMAGQSLAPLVMKSLFPQ